MNYNIKIKCEDSKEPAITVNAFDGKGGIDFEHEVAGDETLRELVRSISKEAKGRLANRVITEKVRIPNAVVTN